MPTLGAMDAIRLLAAGVAAAFEGEQQAVFERRVGLLQESGDDARDHLRTGEPVAVGRIVRAHRVARPLAASRAGMGNDVVLAVDDAELAVVEIRIVGREHAHDLLRRVALRQHVQGERIDMAQIERLGLADADVRPHAFIAPAASHREGGRADAEFTGARAARDDRVGHAVSFRCCFFSFSANSTPVIALRGLRARSS